MKEANEKIELTDYQLGYITGMKHLLGGVLEEWHEHYLDDWNMDDMPQVRKTMHDFLLVIEKDLKSRTACAILDARQSFEEENSLREGGEWNAGHQDQ